MGNCVACGGTTVTAAGGCGRRWEDRKRRRMSWEAPREDQLGMVPGRIFSNDGRSRTASLFTQKGRKEVINQDAMLVWDWFGGEDDGVLCGVFDGHGPHGNFVSRRVRDVLPLKLMSAALASCRNGLDMPVAAWRKAFKRAYKAMDKDLCSPPSLDYFDSGSTAVTVLKLGSDLYIANIGDSRAVLGSRDGGGMVAVQLTDDLKPDVPSEAERIKKCGGRVTGLQEGTDVPRVCSPLDDDDDQGLAMTRAFGDFSLKDYGVISVPDFFHWSLTEKDQFVILASDGVWDVLSSQEAVDIVSSSSSRSTAAKSLVEAAACIWKTMSHPTAETDDCTVVCLYLDGKMDHVRDSLVQLPRFS